MPKIACPCGFVHDLTPIPDKGWVTVRDEAYEAVIEAHIEQHSIAGHSLPKGEGAEAKKWDVAGQTIAAHTGRLFECARCGRVLWKKEGQETYRVFHPDESTA